MSDISKNNLKEKFLSVVDPFLLKNNIHLSTTNARLVIVVVVIYMGFSIFGSMASISYQKKLIEVTEKRIDTGHQNTISEIITNCQGDKTDAEVINACMENSKSEMTQASKEKISEERMAIFKRVVLFLLVLGSYLFLIFRQKYLKESQQATNGENESA